jgi:hypothetical protein
VAFCDIIEERAQKAAAEYGAEGSLVFTDYHSCWRTRASTLCTCSRRTAPTRRFPSRRWRPASMSCAKSPWRNPPPTHA